MTEKNELTLLIDGNWFWMSRMFVLGNLFTKDQPDEAKESAKQALHELMARSIALMLTKNPVIDNVVICADGGSWRKELPIPEQLKDTTYKGNRTEMTDIDWDLAYKTLESFLDYAHEQGVTVSRGYGIEGDDWMWYWTRRLNEDGINTVIWSSDCDLKQLVQLKSNTFTAWYNERAGLCLPEQCKEPDDPMEYFMNPPVINSTIVKLKKNNPEIHYINPDEIAINKILCGDAGDNIMAIIRYKKNNRTYKFAPKDYEKLVNDLGLTTMEQLVTDHESIVNHIVNNPKFATLHLKKEDVDEMLTYNTRLVWLNEAVLPNTVTSKMVEQEYKRIDVNDIKYDFKFLVRPTTDVDIESLFAEAQ